MGINSQVLGAIKSAFRMAGDAKKSVTLKTATSSFAPVTGVTTKSWANETAQGLLMDYTEWEFNQGAGKILGTDQKLIIQQADLTNEPDIGDDSRIVIDSITYLIAAPLKKDSFGAVYELQLRIA